MSEYVGLDVSKEETSFCVMDAGGEVLASGKTLSDPDSLFATLRAHTLCPEQIVLETGTLSGWLARGLRGHGLPVDVIDASNAACHVLRRNSVRQAVFRSRTVDHSSRGPGCCGSGEVRLTRSR